MSDDTMNDILPPIRLCCLQRHYGIVCPDGRVQCCLCFDLFEQSDLNINDKGKMENVCKNCAKKSMKIMRGYSGVCDCGVRLGLRTSDGRHNLINFTCPECKNVMRLNRNKELDCEYKKHKLEDHIIK